jgi:hypothetical protein
MVVDVWETPEQFEQFSREQIGPLTQQAGITEQPEVTAYPVHNWLGASRAETGQHSAPHAVRRAARASE